MQGDENQGMMGRPEGAIEVSKCAILKTHTSTINFLCKRINFSKSPTTQLKPKTSMQKNCDVFVT